MSRPKCHSVGMYISRSLAWAPNKWEGPVDNLCALNNGHVQNTVGIFKMLCLPNYIVLFNCSMHLLSMSRLHIVHMSIIINVTIFAGAIKCLILFLQISPKTHPLTLAICTIEHQNLSTMYHYIIPFTNRKS